MVQSNYTVSTVAQLLGGMPVARSSGSKSKSTTTRFSTLSKPDPDSYTDRTPAPTKPLPPTPVSTVKVRASRSSDVLGFTEGGRIRSTGAEIPGVITEEGEGEEGIRLPATVYTPTTPRANHSHSHSRSTSTSRSSSSSKTPTLAPTVSKTIRVPVLEAPRKGNRDSTGHGLENRISQYYEYITPPVSLMGSRRERKASHSPTNSAGSVDIYFSPIDATRSEAFLSSPLPSPEIEGEGVVEPAIEPVTAKRVEMVEIAGIGRVIDGRKVTLTLAHVDRITTALAKAPLVQMRVRGTFLDGLPGNMTNTGTTSANTTHLPAPPPSETSLSTATTTPDSTSTISLLDPLTPGNPITLTSSPSPSPEVGGVGTCTHLSLPYTLSTLSALRIEPSPKPELIESRILLQTLHATLDRKSHARSFTLLAETDVTPSFARAALTELAAKQNLSLDDLEIRTPVAPYSPDESVDWCHLEPDTSAENGYVAMTMTVTSPVTDILAESLEAFASPAQFNAESCTMQTLTLLSELARLKKANETFLVLEPTKWDGKGEVVGVRIPLISEGLRLRFEKMGGSGPGASSGSGKNEADETEAEGSKKTFSEHAAATTPTLTPQPATESSSSLLTINHGGHKGRLFREAIIAAVVPRFIFGEEFETGVVLEGGEGRVRMRCVPLFGAKEDERAEKWVCSFGGWFW